MGRWLRNEAVTVEGFTSIAARHHVPAIQDTTGLNRPQVLARIKAQLKAPLKDAAAVNATHWALWENSAGHRPAG